MLELDGDERGACGHRLAEQREVVERKMTLVVTMNMVAPAG